MSDKMKYAVCQVPDCKRKHHGKGYCKKHFYQIKKYGTLKPENERNKKNEIIIKGNQAEIIIWDKYKKKQVKAIIDSEDVEKIKDYYWHISPWKVISARKAKSLARFIICVPENKRLLYKNKNRLDCRKSNLVVGTRQQMLINSKLHANNTSGHRGINWDKTKNRWCASIGYKGQTYLGGCFKEKEDAIAARKKLEAAYHNHLKFNIEDIEN